MNIRFFIGSLIDRFIIFIINHNYKLLPFIPNGRYVTLDIKRSGQEINLIFDVGSNIGQTAMSFKKSFTKATIYCFEPVQSTYKKLLYNTHIYKQIKCFQLALGEQNQALNIYSNTDSELNSLNVKAETSEEGTLVNVTTGSDFCNNHNISKIDLLKIDVEGFELQVLKGFQKSYIEDNIKFIYAEVGFVNSDILKTNFSLLAEYLHAHNYQLSGFYEPFRWGDAKMKLSFCNALFINLKHFKN